MSDCVVDSSVLLAIVLSEDDAPAWAEKLVKPGRRVVSAATLLEAAVAAERRGGLEARDRLDRLLQRIDPDVVAFDIEHLGWAREAYRRFGKGRHPAALNLGDCISYATARHAVLPLLFKGDDFARTDIERA
ncbi:MAG TPA: type II toxin-antitoxin system VapC family toxin [Archangium sp.]